MPGVAFPVTNEATGKRSTTKAAKIILSAAIGAAGPAGQVFANALMGESDKKWRYGYIKHMQLPAELAAAAGFNENGSKMQVAIAKAGLQKAHETLIFERAGSNYTMADVVAADGPFKGGSFDTGCVTGDRSISSRGVGISVPYEGKSLRKDSLLSEVRRWARNGSCEPSFAEGIGAAIRNEEEWFDLTGKIFVLVGATSEMGPLSFLLERGATVVALARPNSARKPNKWANVLKTAKLGCGKLFFPVTSGKESVVEQAVEEGKLAEAARFAGADATADTPEIINWLSGLFPGETMHIVSLIYMDGEGFVRASLAMDAIVSALRERREKPPALVYIDTPTHAHIVPQEASDFSKRLRSQAPVWQRLLQFIGLLNPMRFKSLSGGNLIPDALAIQQGPNYAIAKYIQRWRAMVARSSGQIVSITVGPATNTVSVLHSPTMRRVMENVSLFQPLVAMQPETVSSLLAIIMIRDICDPSSKAQPATPLEHPSQLILDQAWHGGVFRSAWDWQSSGKIGVIYSYIKQYKFVLIGLLLMALVGARMLRGQ